LSAKFIFFSFVRVNFYVSLYCLNLTINARASSSFFEAAPGDKYEDTCLVGIALDVRVVATGDRVKIKEECFGKLNGMKALRAPYIYMSDHSIPYNVSLASYEYMLELFWENCRY